MHLFFHKQLSFSGLELKFKLFFLKNILEILSQRHLDFYKKEILSSVQIQNIEKGVFW